MYENQNLILDIYNTLGRFLIHCFLIAMLFKTFAIMKRILTTTKILNKSTFDYKKNKHESIFSYKIIFLCSYRI